MKKMDILRYVNSKDIRKHLKEIDYKFSSLEAAWLVYQCHDATIDEKHRAWKEIIETMPDCRIEARRTMSSQESLHAFLKRYMDIEDRLIKEFLDEKHGDTFSDDKPYVYKFEYIYRNGLSFDWGTVFSCYDALMETIMEPDEDVDLIRCTKMRIDRLSGYPQTALITPRLDILKIDPGILDGDEDEEIYFGVFEELWFDFPTPFKKGDIVWKPGRVHGKAEAPFVVDCIGLCGIENENTRESIRLFGDNTDMNAVGYFADEHGVISRDNVDNYMDIEYYDRELTGAGLLLKMVSDVLKGKADKDLLELSCRNMAAGHIREGIQLAGLSPELERECDRKDRYGKIDRRELGDNSCAKVTLDDYDWMHYTAEFDFRTERYGKMKLLFAYAGTTNCTMTVMNHGVTTVYEFESGLFEKWIVKYLAKHMEQWEGAKVFAGEDLMLELYNEVIEQGVNV